MTIIGPTILVYYISSSYAVLETAFLSSLAPKVQGSRNGNG